jgi:poly(3-hydroxybutyrate) depolymerase
MTGLSAGGARAKVLLSTVPRPLLGRDYCRPAICKPRLPSRRHSSGCAGRASRNRENCATEFSQHPFIRDHGRQLRLHGPRDSTVAVVNAHAIVEQWRGVHDPGREPSLTETVDGQARKIWKDNSGREHVNLDEGMVRGLPRHVAGRGPYMLDVVYRRLSTLPIRSEHGSFCR